MVEEVERFLAEHEKGVYDRENFDRYASKRKLVLSCPVIHITGSNGKGSVAHYLEAIYRAAGYRVATFTKPQFYEVNETIRFDGANITDGELSSLWDANKKDFEKFKLTAFEATVALAYRYFESKKPDLAIVEAGMGGAIDATNLDDLDTRLAIITTVSLEHTAYLGTTPEMIALHKAGIIKPEVPVLVGKVDDNCLDVIRREAKNLRSTLCRPEEYHFEHVVDGVFHFDYANYKDIEISSFALYQVKNACLAIEAVRQLSATFPVSEENLRTGLKADPLPGRLERIGRIVFDGAHNPEAMENLYRCLFSASKGRKIHAIFASFRDKNIAVELPCLANGVADITLTTFDHPRARTEDEYFLYVADHPFDADPIGAVERLLDLYPEDVVLITGSLYFVGLMRKAILEKGLNLK